MPSVTPSSKRGGQRNNSACPLIAGREENASTRMGRGLLATAWSWIMGVGLKSLGSYAHHALNNVSWESFQGEAPHVVGINVTE